MSEQNERTPWDPKPKLFRLEEGDQMTFDDVQSGGSKSDDDGFERVEGVEVDFPPEDTFTAEDALTIAEGLEVEDSEPEWCRWISKPFDPSRIRMTSRADW